MVYELDIYEKFYLRDIMERITKCRALLIDENNKKFNGIAIFEKDCLVLEKRSRLNDKLKESLKVSYGDIPLNGINRPAFNRVEFKLKDSTYVFKTIDKDKLDEFEKELSNRATAIDDMDERSTYKIPKGDIPDQIRKYHDLYKDGIITEEEFESQKKKLLDL